MSAMVQRMPWLVVLAATAIVMITMGGRQVSGLFIAPINASAGLGIVAISFALAVGQFTWGLSQPVFGALADRYGPSRVIAMGGVMIEFSGRREKEKIVPLDSAILSKASHTGSEQPDQPAVTPGRITVAEMKATDIANRLDVVSQPAQSIQPIQPIQPIPSVQPIPPILPPSPFAWARWGGQLPVDTLSQPYAEARAGRDVTIGNKYFALFRAPSALTGLEPRAGAYDFNLARDQVHFVGNGSSWQTQDSPFAKLDAATLRVDFAQREFATHLEMSHPQAGAAVLDLSGPVQDNGIFGAQDAAGKVAGALSTDGAHAGMLFEREVQAGTFHGITDWTKK